METKDQAQKILDLVRAGKEANHALGMLLSMTAKGMALTEHQKGEFAKIVRHYSEVDEAASSAVVGLHDCANPPSTVYATEHVDSCVEAPVATITPHAFTVHPGQKRILDEMRKPPEERRLRFGGIKMNFTKECDQ